MRLILACAALALVATNARAQAPQKSVLFVYSGESAYTVGGLASPIAVLDLALERRLRAGLGGALLYYSEHVDTTRLGDAAYVKDMRSLLVSKYASRKLDLIVVFGDVAVDFVSRFRAAFFPEVPIVFGTTDPVAAMPNSTGVRGQVSQQKVLDTALLVRPETRHVAIVAGTTSYDQYYVRAAREAFTPYEGRLSFTYLTGLPMRELLSRVATLPPHSIILFMGVTRDGDGRLFLPQEVLNSISTAANAPTFGWNAIGVGLGLVGGTVYSQEVEASTLAAVGLRVMRGERIETIPVAEVDWAVTQFDWRQLQRWGISDSLLPAHSTVLFRQPGIWEVYRAYILGGGAILVLQTALIVGLVIQRVRRKRIEVQNQHLAGRLIVVQEEERSRVARELHDDVSQQLAILAIDLQALGESDPGDAAAGQLVHGSLVRARDIAKSVHNLSHGLHPEKLQLLGLVAALEELRREQSRPGLVVTFTRDVVPRGLPPSLTLCFFRIAQEAVRNAVKHSAAREVRIHLDGSAQRIRMTVDDDGAGFDVEAAWGKGLGLISMRERLEPLGGTLTIRSARSAGTQVEVVAPIRDEVEDR